MATADLVAKEKEAKMITNKAKRAQDKWNQALCDAWNDAYPVGTEVLLKKDFVDELFATKTRSKAQLMSRQPVIWLENVSGCYDLDCVIPKPANTNSPHAPSELKIGD